MLPRNGEVTGEKCDRICSDEEINALKRDQVTEIVDDTGGTQSLPRDLYENYQRGALKCMMPCLKYAFSAPCEDINFGPIIDSQSPTPNLLLPGKIQAVPGCHGWEAIERLNFVPLPGCVTRKRIARFDKVG